jgi:hypothetical protein
VSNGDDDADGWGGGGSNDDDADGRGGGGSNDDDADGWLWFAARNRRRLARGFAEWERGFGLPWTDYAKCAARVRAPPPSDELQ